ILAAGGANGGAGFLNALVNLNADPAITFRIDNAAPAILTCNMNVVTAPGTAALAGTGTFPAAYPDGAIIVGNALGGNLQLTNAAGAAFTLITPPRRAGWVNGAMIASSTTTGSGFASGTDRIMGSATSCPDLGSGRLMSTTNTVEERFEVRVGTMAESNATID